MTEMKTPSFRRLQAGFTLVELLVYLTIAVVIAGITYSFLTSSSMLYAKNMSIVHSHEHLRSSFDRLCNNLQQSNSVPVLINTSGAVTAAPSPGIYYDRFIGDPYIVANPTGTGLAATVTSVTLTRSTSPLASPPAPGVGDAILIDDPNGVVRALVSASVPGAVDAGTQRQSHALTLAAPLGKTLSWTVAEVRTAMVVHREAFLVVPVGNKSELRFFPNFEPMPTLTDATKYLVISNQISVLAGETTPFSISLAGTDSVFRASLFARSTDYSTWLANKQANEFNTFVRVNAACSSRLHPR